MPKLSLQGLLYINTSSAIHDLFINQHIYCYIIFYCYLWISWPHAPQILSHPPANRPQRRFLFFIQLFLNPFPWGQGVDRACYPGPSIHPIISLKMYIFTVHICNLLWNELNKYVCLVLSLKLFEQCNSAGIYLWQDSLGYLPNNVIVQTSIYGKIRLAIYLTM